MHFDNVGQLFDRVQNSRSRFTMYKSHMSDIGIIAQIVVYIFHRYLLCFFKSKHIIIEVIIFGNITHAVSVSAVAANQKFVFRSDSGAKYSFHAIGPASLQKYRSIIFNILCGNAHQIFAQFLNNAEVIIFVPCTPVSHHGFFYCFRRGQRTGS